MIVKEKPANEIKVNKNNNILTIKTNSWNTVELWKQYINNLELEAVYDKTMVGLADFLEKEYGNLMKIAKMNDHSKNKHSIIKHVDIQTTYLMTDAAPGKNLTKEQTSKI